MNIINVFGIMDIFNLFTLYGENIFRRIFHHLQNCEYNPKKKPYVNLLDNNLNLLNDDNISVIKKIFNDTDKHKCSNNVSPVLSSFFGGNYSKTCTLYYNDFNNNNKLLLDNIGNTLIPYFEKLTNKKLKLGNSDFKCIMLSYEGEDSNFSWHYDTEHKQCFRTLFLFDKSGNISPFSYINENHKKINIDFKLKDGIFFKGTTTYHGVNKSNDKNQIRRIICWQFIEDPIDSDEMKSICSELRARSPNYIICLSLFYILIFSILINYINNNIYVYVNILSNNIIYGLTTIIILYSVYLSKFNSTFKLLIKFYLVCLIFCGFNINISILLFNYIIVTEKILDLTTFKF